MSDRQTGNQLLNGLAGADLRRLLPHLEEVSLVQKQPINTPGQSIDQVYSPTTAVISMIASLDEGSAVELGSSGARG